ncbi:nitroreductase family protein [Rheinheimera sp. D18]|uniref:nitroreductase family protein n=1 Tax=Rheinheimera sp. D18 TaxID=2545632 RepID=UPI001044E80E|nr:nitroreductase family protein [Rheinheimera sp. D18]QBL09779.1 nitroreductase family protein [Rheinheimera sp. D18]
MLNKLKRLIPHSWRIGIKSQLNQLELVFLRLFAFNGFLASIYYTFFSRQFYREHKAVLQGRLAYQRTLSDIKFSSALLRRNIHRLEKGLIMRPRRPVFALDYLGETIDCFIKVAASPQFCRDEFQWATDVLDEYFAVVAEHPTITAAKKQFQQVLKPDRTNAVPYCYAELIRSDCSYNQLMTLLQRRRSVRWFLPKAVDANNIKLAAQAASLAPSACNRQPYQFMVAHGEKAIAMANCAMGTIGFAENFPCVIAIVADLSAYPAERDRHVIYIDASLAAMQFMLALETLGLASCPINWPDIELREQQLSKILGLEYHQRVVMLLAVGYADPEGGIAYSQKKPDRLLVKDVC